jgi:hypothetical protein
MLPIFLGQAAMTVGLVAAMWVRPPRTHAGLASQLLGTLLALAGLARVGLWLFPPWWTPHLAALLVVAGCLRAWSRSRAHGAHTRPFERLRVASFGLLALVSGALLLIVVSAVRPPDDLAVIDLAFPLEAGRYLVVNGGTAELVNAHRQSMDSTKVHLRPWRGNGYAVDIAATDAFGLRARSLQPAEPSEYEIFGRAVAAPCAGSVVIARDGLPDMPPPVYDRSHPAGNHVVLDCAGIHIVLAHLRRGSVTIQVGMKVPEGAILGEVGNSGGTDEPHLHIHAQRPGRPDAPMGGDPLPMRLGGRFLVRGDRFVQPKRKRSRSMLGARCKTARPSRVLTPMSLISFGVWNVMSGDDHIAATAMHRESKRRAA